MGPLEHPDELGAINEIPFEGREEDLRRVAEDNHAEGDGEVVQVQRDLHFGPAPLGDEEETEGEDDGVDEEVGHGAVEAECGHVVEGLEEGEGDEEDADEEHPGAAVDEVREGADEEVAADEDVEDAGHEEFDQLGCVDEVGPEFGAETVPRHGLVGIACADSQPRGVRLVQTLHEDLPCGQRRA